MTNSPVCVLIIDDDFMIARMHGKYIESEEGYDLAGIALNGEQALSMIDEKKPDLLLLDVYMPDCSGIELLRTIRTQQMRCDIILITAAKELEIVEEGFRLGIFDYLVKPFDLEHLRNTLTKYMQFRNRLSSAGQINQEIVNDLKNLRVSRTQPQQFHKGIDDKTLNRIKKYLIDAKNFQTVDEIALRAGVSKTTVRNYINYLLDEEIVEELLQYGTIGRPQKLYRLRK
ncbi:response regulator [Paenibacillus filicis]|uniref:Transcriptional regulatory protein n=1 Tax=Paenibacillus gyeongsangnamensis TaxID=3388067 RepID=A0ABT4QCJ3_9BACL|nr:response regulator [Paenibacillus filicis]MCZ8514390.1 response regulator [Paenibacillus filicis]